MARGEPGPVPSQSEVTVTNITCLTATELSKNTIQPQRDKTTGPHEVMQNDHKENKITTKRHKTTAEIENYLNERGNYYKETQHECMSETHNDINETPIPIKRNDTLFIDTLSLSVLLQYLKGVFLFLFFTCLGPGAHFLTARP